MLLKIPYQNHQNKQLFDYILSCRQQINNINFARSFSDVEAKEDNFCYLVIKDDNVYLFVAMSNDQCNPIMSVWIKLADVKVIDSSLINNYLPLVYKFDIKRFYSVLSFSLDYKNRNIIQFDLSDITKIDYKLSKEISVTLANNVETGILYDRIMLNIKSTILNDKIDSENYLFETYNVDKNSFLLPYFNHKDCLNFAIASVDNKSYITKISGVLYFVNIYIDSNEDNKVKYVSFVKLREDKFGQLYDFIDNFAPETHCINVSTGLWQLLVMLQNNKQWKTLKFRNNSVELVFSDNCSIFHYFDKCITESKIPNQVNEYMTNFKLVGELSANEIFLLDKLYKNSKNSYFDFSIQKFIGDGYVFANEKSTEKAVINFETKLETELPLIISFTELKHYIGSDLSQKEFILKFSTNGTDVMLDKFEKQNNLVDVRVIYNHYMSKIYLGI